MGMLGAMDNLAGVLLCPRCGASSVLTEEDERVCYLCGWSVDIRHGGSTAGIDRLADKFNGYRGPRLGGTR